jgi:hypothetical protein
MILQLLYPSVLSISNYKASISYLRSLIKDLILLHCTPLSSILALSLSETSFVQKLPESRKLITYYTLILITHSIAMTERSKLGR